MLGLSWDHLGEFEGAEPPHTEHAIAREWARDSASASEAEGRLKGGSLRGGSGLRVDLIGFGWKSISVKSGAPV